ncbi:uncharacterized protein LOC127251905 [Andrographis paniculata]|uniref:uncharacterized protein LOC127251905 n=1 Tax=Andrographis paniculata TaxID=175694 RepID=UPI0021E8642F|nr:uncharacterized protein LOC127251905 [Andrographis paniculata]XP_051131810.1 uncharacterized protein LOC127251905 [Andrographis paniculata]XP_051131811.1 uncharacterized protein LOC127251905 [Andrographis paniculata]
MGDVLGQGTSERCRIDRSQHNYTSGLSIDRPYLSPESEYRQTEIMGQLGRNKPSKNVPEAPWDRRSSFNGDYDELVKHMSNLPGFLQRVEKENSVQEKALNFGVLEWNRLEKWKYTERMPKISPKKTSASSNSIPTSGQHKISPNFRHHSISQGRHPTSLYPGKQSLQRGTLFSSPPRRPLSCDGPHLNPTKEKRDATHHKDGKFVGPFTSKGKETCNQEFHAAQSGIIGRRPDHCKQRLKSDNRSSEMNREKVKKNDLKEEVILGKQVRSPELGKHISFVPTVNKIKSLEKRNEIQSDNGEPQVIVISERNHFEDKICAETIDFMESRTSVNDRFSEVARNRFSGFCPTRDFDYGGFSFDASHSCPLPSVPTIPTQSVIEQHDNGTSSQSATSGNDSMMHKETSAPSSSTEASHIASPCVAEKPVVKRRASSPAHRFSFDLGRVGRTFSFKDNSQLNSADISVTPNKVRHGAHSSVDNIAAVKETPSGRARSSPLRRLLDPLLKQKGTGSSETNRPTGRSSYSMTVRTTTTKGPSQDKNPGASVLQALLQLTFKNGRPCFKLVVDNTEDMLAAGLKSLPASGKNDPCMVYTFYSVREIRKKAMNWITQGVKSKNCSLGYDIIGQMKISNFYHLRESAGGSVECEATECVLHGINPGQGDKQSLEFAPGTEIAAIIVESSTKIVETLFGSAEVLDSDASKMTSGTTVILPGGVHGVPVKGTPSSLISRWRSGGLCDCGGWDVGCKLRVLADHKKSSNGHHSSSTFGSNVDSLHLSPQGGEHNSKHALSLEPLSNGLYSVEFDRSISLTEAFATCVAYITCRKLPEFTDIRGGSDAHNVPEDNADIHERRTPTKLQEQQNMAPHQCPPLSPAGRI